MDIEGHLHIAAEIDSEAEFETSQSYEDRVSYYKSQRYTYIPLIENGEYYNTEEGWVRDMHPDQYVSEDTHLLEVLRRLQDQPFVIVDYLKSTRVYQPKEKALQAGLSEDEVESDTQIQSEEDEEMVKLTSSQLSEYFPEVAEEMYGDFSGYGIITLSDINRRPVKDMLYKVFSELSSQLSRKIEGKYANSESILKHMRPTTIGYWWKDQDGGLDLHIAEHMNLLEMMQVIQSSDDKFVQSCGFSSKGDVERLNSINNIRNKVMHANRSLIYDRQDIQRVLDAVESAQSVINNIE